MNSFCHCLNLSKQIIGRFGVYLLRLPYNRYMIRVMTVLMLTNISPAYAKDFSRAGVIRAEEERRESLKNTPFDAFILGSREKWKMLDPLRKFKVVEKIYNGIVKKKIDFHERKNNAIKVERCTHREVDYPIYKDSDLATVITGCLFKLRLNR